MQLSSWKLPEDVHFTSSGTVVFDIRISLPCGQLSIRNVKFWVIDQKMTEVLIGRPLLRHIGMDLEKLLTKLCKEGSEIDASSADVDESGGSTIALSSHRVVVNDSDIDPIKEIDEAAANMGEEKAEEISTAVKDAIIHARAKRMSEQAAKEAEALLFGYRDVLRIKLGNDPLAQVEPHRVELKRGVQPHRATVRRYPPSHTAFINATVHCLDKIGEVRRNVREEWASAVLVVPKPVKNKFRFTVDLRSVKNLPFQLQAQFPTWKACSARSREA